MDVEVTERFEFACKGLVEREDIGVDKVGVRDLFAVDTARCQRVLWDKRWFAIIRTLIRE